jgi:DNA-binding transcriptional ArsR family regulator
MRSDVAIDASTVLVERPGRDSVTGLDGCATACVHPDRVALVIEAAPGEQELSRVSSVFKLIGDPTRARLLYALLEAGELCVCDLSAATGTAESTVSQALRLLKASSVVSGRREGRNVFYRLSDAHVRLLLDVTREHALHGSRDGGTTG